MWAVEEHHLASLKREPVPEKPQADRAQSRLDARRSGGLGRRKEIRTSLIQISASRLAFRRHFGPGREPLADAGRAVVS